MDNVFQLYVRDLQLLVYLNVSKYGEYFNGSNFESYDAFSDIGPWNYIDAVGFEDFAEEMPLNVRFTDSSALEIFCRNPVLP
jgi:hypothetical protein